MCICMHIHIYSSYILGSFFLLTSNDSHKIVHTCTNSLITCFYIPHSLHYKGIKQHTLFFKMTLCEPRYQPKVNRCWSKAIDTCVYG